MFTSNMTYQKTITMVTEICCNCGVAFGLPSDLQEQLKNDPNKYFHCPNGHSQHYAKSKEQRLREEAEKALRLKENEMANLASAKIQLEDQLKKSEQKLKRLTNGVCPCCNRTFSNLHNHMKKQHPEVVSKSR